MDGSSSIRPAEFSQLKTFLVLAMRSFPENTLFSLLQFSHTFEEHFNFRTFQGNRDPSRLLTSVRQLGGTTHTASGIRKAVELFAANKGARNTAKKFLVIVTKGEKTGDPLEYAEVVEEADRAGVTRFAVGVGLAFLTRTAQRELHAIASQPATDHIIKVRHFTDLRGIETQLAEKICASHGIIAPKPTTTPPQSPDSCPSHSDSQVMVKLERVLSSLDQIRSKLDLMAAREGKCGQSSHRQV
ncbi:integrin alpha-M-like isoform X2 [Tiliqua scincoides]